APSVPSCAITATSSVTASGAPFARSDCGRGHTDGSVASAPVSGTEAVAGAGGAAPAGSAPPSDPATTATARASAVLPRRSCTGSSCSAPRPCSPADGPATHHPPGRRPPGHPGTAATGTANDRRHRDRQRPPPPGPPTTATTVTISLPRKPEPTIPVVRVSTRVVDVPSLSASRSGVRKQNVSRNTL